MAVGGLNPLVRRALERTSQGSMDVGLDMTSQFASKVQGAKARPDYVTPRAVTDATQNLTSAVGDAVAGVMAGLGGAVGARSGGSSRSAQGTDIDRILATIRQLESGGNYGIRSKYSTASGAYQFIDPTWNNYGGYRSAYLAPKAVQDARARQDVQRFLASSGGKLDAVPGNWYYPKYYQSGQLSAKVPGGGNPLTVGQYIQKWLNVYNSLK